MTPSAPRFLPVSRRKSLCAYSLVEVVLALGVISFAFMSVVGLLPIGLNSSREAADATVHAQIRQHLVTQAQQADFSQLESLNEQPPLYFSHQGNLVEGGTKEALYKAAFAISAPTSLPGNHTDHLATVTLYILNLASQHGESPQSLAANPGSRKYSIFVADNGR